MDSRRLCTEIELKYHDDATEGTENNDASARRPVVSRQSRLDTNSSGEIGQKIRSLKYSFVLEQENHFRRILFGCLRQVRGTIYTSTE